MRGRRPARPKKAYASVTTSFRLTFWLAHAFLLLIFLFTTLPLQQARGSSAAISVLTSTWEGDSSSSLQLFTALADVRHRRSSENLSNTSMPKIVGLAGVSLSNDPNAQRREFFPGHTTLSPGCIHHPLHKAEISLVPTARASTRHYSAIIREIVCHFAGCDCAKLGYQNKLLVSSGVLSDRQDEDISFATSTHHGQVTVEPFSVEERDATDQRITR